MASLTDYLRSLAQKLIPTRTVIVRSDTRYDPESATSSIDVDSLHGTIEEARIALGGQHPIDRDHDRALLGIAS